jgi:hypothetical protein
MNTLHRHIDNQGKVIAKIPYCFSPEIVNFLTALEKKMCAAFPVVKSLEFCTYRWHH